MKKIIPIICLSIVLCTVKYSSAQTVSRNFLKGYKKNLSAEKCSISLENPGFQKNGQSWHLPGGYTIDSTGGRNGTVGLKYERRSPKDYRLAYQVVKLQPLMRYRFSVWVRTKNLRGKNGGGTICLEFYKNGKFLRGSYPNGISENRDEWSLVAGETTVPKDADTCRLTLYLRPKTTGIVWFDDAEIGIAKKMWNAWITSGGETLPKTNANINISLYHESGAVKPNDKNNFKCLIEASTDKFYSARLSNVANDRVVATFASLPKGIVDLKISFINTKKKIIYYQKKMMVKIIDDISFNEKPKLFDKNGNFLVNGKPFMPIGIFTNPNSTFAEQPEKVFRKISQGGFNCILPYHSETLRLDWKKKPSIERIKKALDFCNELDLKVIFGIEKMYPQFAGDNYSWMKEKGLKNSITKIVTSFKSHPALLAWYISDENSNIKQVTQVNRLVHELDSRHPTYSVQYKYDKFPMFGGTSDIIGVDPYPVRSNKTHSMAQVLYAMQQANKISGTPNWSVPQIFNWGPITAKYLSDEKKKRFVKTFRDPTEEEIRSMVLLMAIKGAKGFIFWQYEELYRPPLTQDDFNRQWPKVCRVAKMLKKLTPFIVSNNKPKDITVQTIKGNILAKEFTDNQGQKRILIAAIGPGEAQGVLLLKNGKYKSIYNKTIKQGQGQYIFSAQNISSDILEAIAKPSGRIAK